jgi:cytoskeletal protein CcmA (bactofilin family)
MAKKEQVKGELQAFLGKGTEFKGTLLFDGVVRLDGKIEGEIASDGHLVVGREADVQAEVKVGFIQVAGKIVGNITAKDRVEILSSGKVVGDITTPKLAVEEGAHFTGRCQMELDRGEERVIPMGKGTL